MHQFCKEATGYSICKKRTDMKAPGRNIIIMVLAACLSGCLADYSSKPVCRVENNRLIFKLYLRWNEEQKREVALQYDLDTALVNAAFGNLKEVTRDSITWKIQKKHLYFVELSKTIDSKSAAYISKNDVFMVEDSWVRRPNVGLKLQTNYGVNSFSDIKTFEYKDTIATFTLDDYRKAERVYISGSFNDWDTQKTPMEKTATGWTVRVKLKPGKYTYKYIVDGKWVTDPGNNQQEREDIRGIVSVVFCPNYLFLLKDKPDAKKVVVTGNFLKWNTGGIKMVRYGNQWSLPVWFRDGTYAYKFIVDGVWQTDPSNPDIREDADGNSNSFLSIGEKHFFRLEGNLNAKKVVLSGSFNNWSGNELLMKKTDAGWEIDYAIPAGNYEYKFLIDGIWTRDMANPLASGKDKEANSIIIIHPNYTFTLEKYKDATDVVVAGSFNGWNKVAYRMIKKDDKWIFPVYLAPGKYTYKYIVNGTWIIDPANELYEANEYGTDNSVLWIEQ
jgi:hypothetical protein